MSFTLSDFEELMDALKKRTAKSPSFNIPRTLDTKLPNKVWLLLSRTEQIDYLCMRVLLPGGLTSTVQLERVSKFEGEMLEKYG